MHWLQAALSVAVALASWRWLVRPLRRAFRELVQLLRQIRDASGGVQALASELRELAGANVQLAKVLIDELEAQRDQLDQHAARLDDLAELYVDLAAAAARHAKADIRS